MAESRLALTAGEAGIGKTTLLRAAIRESSGNALKTIACQCSAIERMTPYYAWREVFQQLLGLTGISSPAQRCCPGSAATANVGRARAVRTPAEHPARPGTCRERPGAATRWPGSSPATQRPAVVAARRSHARPDAADRDRRPALVGLGIVGAGPAGGPANWRVAALHASAPDRAANRVCPARGTSHHAATGAGIAGERGNAPLAAADAGPFRAGCGAGRASARSFPGKPALRRGTGPLFARCRPARRGKGRLPVGRGCRRRCRPHSRHHPGCDYEPHRSALAPAAIDAENGERRRPLVRAI